MKPSSLLSPMDDAALDRPTADRSKRHALDETIRARGYEIHGRPKKGEPLMGAVKRMIDNIIEADGFLVSIARHGRAGSQIHFTPNDLHGYVVTYYCAKSCGTWEKT
jgi:hypothetical protein